VYANTPQGKPFIGRRRLSTAVGVKRSVQPPATSGPSTVTDICAVQYSSCETASLLPHLRLGIRVVASSGRRGRGSAGSFVMPSVPQQL
jgi:hypothetical protein